MTAKKRPLPERGDYRPFYCAFWDDYDVQRLPDRAYRVLTTLRGTLPAPGIGVVAFLQLAERCNCTRAELEEALTLLERPKPDRSAGWIVRSGNVVWVVNGLRYHPTLSLNNENHRAYVANQLAPLNQALPVVRAFRQHYADWLPPKSEAGGEDGGQADGGAPATPPAPSPRGGGGIPSGYHPPSHADGSASTHDKRQATSDVRHATGDSDARARLAAAPPPSVAPAPATPNDRLAALRVRFLDRCYGAATPERRASVSRQLDRLLTDRGAHVRKGQRAKATPELLTEVLEEVLDAPPDLIETAIYIVLLRCLDDRGAVFRDAQGRTLEQAAEQLQLEVRDDELARKRERRAVEEWIRANPKRFTELQQAVDREYGVSAKRPLDALSELKRLTYREDLFHRCIRELRATGTPETPLPHEHPSQHPKASQARDDEQRPPAAATA